MRSYLYPLLGFIMVCLGPRLQAQERFTVISNEKACELLGLKETPLPLWARILVTSLPGTTAKMLNLDYVHRERNPLGPVLSSKIRWVVADTLRCEYARQVAVADLKRAGLTDADIARFAEAGKEVLEDERLALAFARQLTAAAYKLTENDLDTLIKRHGPERVVAMVHTVAHANFQQRILLTLGVTGKNDTPLPPIQVKIKETPPIAQRRPDWAEALKKKGEAISFRPDWPEVKAEDLERAVETQKDRKARIRLPGPELLSKLPAEMQPRAKRSYWSHVSLGYQPLLTGAWFDTMGTGHAESKLDGELFNLFFWVITRSNECFY